MDLKLKDNSQLTLPTGYFPVEYVESSGYPNINTGVVFSHSSSNKNKIDCVIDILQETSSTYVYYANTTRYLYLMYSGSDSIFYAKSAGTGTTGGVSVEITGKSHIIHDRTSIIINNVSTSITGQSYGAASGTLYLLNNANSPKTKIYNFKVYDSSGSLVRNYIPAISCQEGHFGEACLYDKANGNFYYSSSTGTFTASSSTNLYSIITSAYTKDCPNVSGINLLRSCINLNRVRLDIGTQSGTVAELYKYAAYAGFNDAYENQTKPRIIGTWTITDYWTNDELTYLQSAFDGLTISYDSSKNVDTLLENGDLAIQTLDSTKDGYNPAAAIILQNAGYGRTLDGPIVEGETGKWFLPKAVASTITSISTIFRNAVDVIDANGIVSDDTTLEYPFTSFEELQYTRITSIAAGSSTSVLGGFGECTKLERIILPETVTTIGAYGFYNCNKLESINIPIGLTSNIQNFCFYNCVSIINFTSPRDCDVRAFRGTSASNTGYQFGNGTGILIIKGTLSTTSVYSTKLYFKKISINGFSWNVSSAMAVLDGTIVRVGGTIADKITNTTPGFNKNVAFLECATLSLNNVTNNRLFSSGGTQEVFIRRADLIPNATPANFGNGTVTKFYVGQGLDKDEDNTTLQLYINDSNWGSVSGILDTWYNYNGEYKWYYITDNLTNCVNTNPKDWYTYPMRGESYETTIVADEGMTINSLTVEMLDTDTTSPTYDTYIPQPTSYDSATGIYTISIPSVTGNVVITASAS